MSDQSVPIIIGDPESVEQAKAYQARRMNYMQHGDLDGLVQDLYTVDAKLHAFNFRVEGRDAIKGMINLLQQRVSALGPVHLTQLIAGRDFIWQELTIDSPTGPIEPYEVKFLRDGQVYLQVYGLKQGNVWQPGDLDGLEPPASGPWVEELHQRYIDYQVQQDADALANHFFTEDARLVTAKLNIEGRDALLAFFRHKFATESGFHLEAIHHLTGTDQYIWFEAIAGGDLGMRTVYDVMLLRDNQVCLQLVGTIEGALPANRMGS